MIVVGSEEQIVASVQSNQIHKALAIKFVERPHSFCWPKLVYLGLELVHLEPHLLGIGACVGDDVGVCARQV
ncbi:hypothetical protein BH10ACI4_BH10ACI4_16410 [soil metagenome]